MAAAMVAVEQGESGEALDVLSAINSHVALSIGTARAAQLELAVHAAERQRDMAQHLRGAMVEFSGSLNPEEVMRRLTQTLQRGLQADTVTLLRAEGTESIVSSDTVGVTGRVASVSPAGEVLAGLLPKVASTATLLPDRGPRPYPRERARSGKESR